ncbi:MAG: hypothetical protein RIS36_73 [Pseudomonadota bacterium]|jgi:hypothetical protein
MRTKRKKIFLASAVTLVICSSVIPRSVYEIRDFSLVRGAHAQAQIGQGIMQNIMPILMLLLLMNMMQQNKGNELQREQATAARNAQTNLLQAGNQQIPSIPQPVVPNPLQNNLLGNAPINPLPIPNPNSLGSFFPK